MILNFDKEITGDFILDKAQSYFDSEDYLSCAKFACNYFSNSSVDCQTFLSTLLARCYHELGSTELATVSLKRAVALDPDYPDALYYLAIYQNELHDKIGVQEAFFALHLVDEGGLMAQEVLSLVISDIQVENEFKLITLEDMKKTTMSDAETLLRQGSFDEALELLLSLNNRISDDVDILNDIAIIYLCMDDRENAKKYAVKAIEIDDCNPNSYFILSKTNYQEPNKMEINEITDKLVSQEITDLIHFKKVASMLELAEDYNKLSSYIDLYDDELSYEVLMMKAITLFNLGNRDDAINLSVEAIKIYGDLSLAKIYKTYFESNEFTHATVGDYQELPSGYAEKFKADGNVLVEKLTAENCHDMLILAMSLYSSDDLYKYFKSNIKVLNNVEVKFFIECINIFSHISKGNKSSVIRYLIEYRELFSFTLFSSGGASQFEYEDIPCIDNYPAIYNSAYKLAFATASLYAHDFENNMLVSMGEFMKNMKPTMHKFRDVKVLTAAILCNSYVIVSDDIITTVSEVMEVKSTSVAKCIDKIKEGGSFFDLDQDEIFSKHIQGVMNRFGVMDNEGE